MTRERFSELAAAEQEPLRRFLLGLCLGDRMEAEDIAQEAFIKAWIASDDFVERHKFSTWLYKIAYRTFLDHVRRPHPPLVPLDEAATLSAAQRADAAFDYQFLYMAIHQLPDKTRAAILLHYINGYSTAEIGRIMGVSPIAVRKLLQRGRTQLKSILTHHER